MKSRYEAMKQCWREVERRPSVKQLRAALCFLQTNRDMIESADFEARWSQQLGYTSLDSVFIDDQIPEVHVDQKVKLNRSDMKFESNFVPTSQNQETRYIYFRFYLFYFIHFTARVNLN